MLNPQRLQVAYDLLQETVASRELPTGLLAVANSREILRCEGYGPDGPLGTEGIYLIASISKPIVATAVMQLVERGRLLIEDPVAKYLPEFALNSKGKVRVWHLLTHTSGMAGDYWDQLKSPPTAEWDLRNALQTHLRFSPGSRCEYCNVSYTILGELIHRLSGLTYQDYLREQLFEPVGMRDTSFNPEPSQLSRVLPVQDLPPFPGGIEAFMAMALPAGGLFSTAADLVAFSQAFLNGGAGRFGRLLGPAALRVMTDLHTQGIFEHKNGELTPAYYGLGWEKAVPQEGRLLSPSGYGHGGMTGGHLWIEPEADLALVFLTNRAGTDGRARKRIINAVMGALE